MVFKKDMLFPYVSFPAVSFRGCSYIYQPHGFYGKDIDRIPWPSQKVANLKWFFTSDVPSLPVALPEKKMIRRRKKILNIYHKVGPYLLINGVITPINGFLNG